ncbi:universal stress protein [Pseudodesulfovibrio tunisiensis]|uniref:universal stress protein n=1 Tax=Pseudodesulfovibrio tunisiensis TaxID=463192 RepID=UPI001FB559EA|nr:universal stress protein [Pseudodesulfovibrio tunisiensis]
MFKKILFATTISPSSDAAARVAFDLAERYESELWALHIVGVPTRAFSHLITDSKTGEEVTLDEDYVSCVRDEMKEYYANQLKSCPDCVLDAASGVPYREILRKAREEDVDLIVMGGAVTEDDKGAFRHKIYAGSTLHAVAKRAQCPVLVVGRPAASFWGGFSRIVFATDFSKASEHAFQFARTAAERYDAELSVFSVMDLSGIHAGHNLSQDRIEDELMEIRRKMRRDYSAQLKGVECDFEAWEGIPYVEIVKYARERGADLVVMALQATEDEAGVIGSTLEQVVMRANCPVICVNRAAKA